MNNNITISGTTLQDCLVLNNRFANVRITADQIGAEGLKEWSTLLDSLHKAAYSVYALCESNNMTADSDSVDKSEVYSVLHTILSVIGDVKGHKFRANEELATLIISYSGKRANSDSPELQLCLSRLRNRQRELTEAQKYNGVNPDFIKMVKEEIERLNEEKSALLAQPDSRIKVPTRTTENAFRLEVEHRLARAISDQRAKSWEQLEAEAEALRLERRGKTAAKKAKSTNK